jgi:hypothetical protein
MSMNEACEFGIPIINKDLLGTSLNLWQAKDKVNSFLGRWVGPKPWNFSPPFIPKTLLHYSKTKGVMKCWKLTPPPPKSIFLSSINF